MVMNFGLRNAPATFIRGNDKGVPNPFKMNTQENSWSTWMRHPHRHEKRDVLNTTDKSLVRQKVLEHHEERIISSSELQSASSNKQKWNT